MQRFLRFSFQIFQHSETKKSRISEKMVSSFNVNVDILKRVRAFIAENVIMYHTYTNSILKTRKTKVVYQNFLSLLSGTLESLFHLHRTNLANFFY